MHLQLLYFVHSQLPSKTKSCPPREISSHRLGYPSRTFSVEVLSVSQQDLACQVASSPAWSRWARESVFYLETRAPPYAVSLVLPALCYGFAYALGRNRNRREHCAMGCGWVQCYSVSVWNRAYQHRVTATLPLHVISSADSLNDIVLAASSALNPPSYLSFLDSRLRSSCLTSLFP